MLMHLLLVTDVPILSKIERQSFSALPRHMLLLLPERCIGIQDSSSAVSLILDLRWLFQTQYFYQLLVCAFKMMDPCIPPSIHYHSTLATQYLRMQYVPLYNSQKYIQNMYQALLLMLLSGQLLPDSSASIILSVPVRHHDLQLQQDMAAAY